MSNEQKQKATTTKAITKKTQGERGRHNQRTKRLHIFFNSSSKV